MVKFKLVWILAGISAAGLFGSQFYNDSNLQEKLTQQTKDTFLNAYNKTIEEYGGKTTTNILDPCSIADSLKNIAPLSECIETKPDD